MITEHNSYYGVKKTRLNHNWNTEYYNQVIVHKIYYCDLCKRYITNQILAENHDREQHENTNARTPGL